MNKVEQIRIDMITAMKNGDKETKGILSFLLGNLKNAEIDKRAELTEEEANAVINKQIKQTCDVLGMIPINRQDLIDENNKTLEVLRLYVPKMLTEDEIRKVVNDTCNELWLDIEALTVKNKGILMSAVIKKTKGIADGNVVNKIVSEYCK